MSGDYESATDTLHQDASQAALDVLCPLLIDPDISALSFRDTFVCYPILVKGSDKLFRVSAEDQDRKRFPQELQDLMMHIRGGATIRDILPMGEFSSDTRLRYIFDYVLENYGHLLGNMEGIGVNSDGIVENPDHPTEHKGTMWFQAVFRQRNGQLMGHPLSFPLLCVINLSCLERAVDLWVKEEIAVRVTAPKGGHVKRFWDAWRRHLGWYRKNHRIHEIHLLLNQELKKFQARKEHILHLGRVFKETAIINGDDILFTIPRAGDGQESRLYELWKSCVKDVGFKLSVGKNYRSRDQVQINSQVYRILPRGGIRRLGYVNQWLMYGEGLCGGNKLEESLLWDPVTHAPRRLTPETLGRELNTMCTYCPRASAIIPTAFYRWKKDFGWNGRAHRPNWFAPVCLGGFGVLPIFSEEKVEYTREQRQWARWFLANPEQALYRLIGSSPLAEAGALSSIEWLTGGDPAFLAQWRLKIVGGVSNGGGREKMSTAQWGAGSGFSLGQIADEWYERAAYVDRVRTLRVPPAEKERRLNKKLQVPITSGFRPLESDKIRLYWNARFYTGSLPPCPPLRPIHSAFGFRNSILEPERRRYLEQQ